MADAGSKFMAAVQYSRYGGGAAALKHVELAIPKPKKGQVLVKVEAAGINPLDWKIQDGLIRYILPSKFPYTAGTDISGEVVVVGPGVTEFSEGDKIVSLLDIRTGGALAQYAVAAPKSTAKRPPEVSALDAATLPVSGLSALQSIRDSAGVKLDGCYRGNILVTAASGGVGVFAVQIAKLGGAHVTATCGARNIDLIKSLGADEVLDYKTPEGSSLKSPSGKKFDAVIHCARNISWSTFEPVLGPRGKVVDLTPNFSSLVASAFKRLTLCKQMLVPFFVSANSKDLGLLVDLVKEGRLKTVIDSGYPMEKAEDAWAKSIEGHVTGKVLVTVD